MSNRGGLAYKNSDVFRVSVRATRELLDPLYLGRALAIGGDFATSGRTARGIILENVASGEMVTLGVMGVMPYYPVVQASAGALMTVDASGQFVFAAAGLVPVGTTVGQYAGGTAPGPNTHVGSGTLGVGIFIFGIGIIMQNPASAGMTGVVI